MDEQPGVALRLLSPGTELPQLARLLDQAGVLLGGAVSLTRVAWVDQLEPASTETGSIVSLIGIGGELGCGLDDLTALRSASSRMPLVALLSSDDELLALAALSAGADEALSLRGLDARRLSRAIERSVARRRAAWDARPDDAGSAGERGLGGRVALPLWLLQQRLAAVQYSIEEVEVALEGEPAAATEGYAVPEGPPRTFVPGAQVREELQSQFRRIWPGLLAKAIETAAEVGEAVRNMAQDDGHQRYRVLVIDDEPTMRSLLREALGGVYDVVTAGGGAEALNLLHRDQRFHAIVCDVSMPGVDGVQVLQSLRSMVPVLASRLVFWTAGGFDGDTQRALLEVPNPVLPKADLALLRETLDRRLRGLRAGGERA